MSGKVSSVAFNRWEMREATASAVLEIAVDDWPACVRNRYGRNKNILINYILNGPRSIIGYVASSDGGPEAQRRAIEANKGIKAENVIIEATEAWLEEITIAYFAAQKQIH